MDKRGWNIHETVYSTNITKRKRSFLCRSCVAGTFTVKKFYYIVKKELSIYFRIVNKGQSIKPIINTERSKQSSFKLNTQSIWNELICGIVSGSRFGTKQLKKKKAVKLKIKKKTPKLKNVLLSISRLRLKKDEIAVYRIRRNKRINLKHLNKNILFIHTNNFTYIIINIHYEPEDLDEYL
jgi:hypothetical protein